MLRIQAMRQAMPGVSYPASSDWQRQFADEFLYTETEDQIGSMRQIDDDMVAPRPMDRLLCGDVGYGKTELAMRAAFRVAEAGKQAAVLVPTTVLADQHYRTFGERFADYPMRIEVLSRFRTDAEQEGILRKLAAGQIDILIGTHRLLSRDVRFADLGLVVIDEEQRFGVRHKEHLKKLRATVDVLTMTATPIPRTMHMALLGLRDISNLTTPPLDRRAIHTEVCHYDDNLIRSAILRELNRDGQVFFVHNKVMDIEYLAEHLHRLVPEARLVVAHGQMPEGRLEKAMLRFLRHDADVLVCTTIIESGLDIPTANTIIIHNADRFGLAELHQLRGRVGRYKHRAYCYLLLPEGRPVSPSAAKRLKAIEDFSDLGAGFQIAMRDLEIRGAGNILGKEQSGHIATVGYELYCQLLERTVKELRGEALPLRRDVHVEIGVDAYIPASYIPSERQRMEIYRRLVRCGEPGELKQLAADLADAYGPVPPVVQTMVDMAEVRVRAGAAGIDSIIRIDPDIVFAVRDFSLCSKVFQGAAGSVRLPDDRTAHWRPPPACLETPTLVNVLLKQLRQAGDQG
jgi:transcription-repair coupling factor (superfamily II helicase)